jgi:bacterioferritin-associated ferredoxin
MVYQASPFGCGKECPTCRQTVKEVVVLAEAKVFSLQDVYSGEKQWRKWSW